MRFGILGPVEAVADDGPVSVAQPRHRALLAYLLLQANRVVTPAQLAEAIWGGAEPATARSQIHVAVSRLRRALRDHGLDDVIVTRPGGYRLLLADDQLDADLFDRQVEAARASAGRGRHEEAARHLRAALGLWRGQALTDITAAFAEPVRQRLLEQRLIAQELLFDAELALGCHDRLIPGLRRLLEEHPTRERVACRLMLAQYRAGLHLDALETARRTRALLAEEQGLDPGPELSTLETAILNGDLALDVSPRAGGVPASSAATTPAQLPFDVQGFAGRRRELAQLAVLTEAADRATMVLVAGTAGVGKTALAVHWAHRHRDRFPDGQFFVDLHGFDAARTPAEPLDVLRRLLRALDVGDAVVPQEVEEAAALFRSRLARRRVLLVLDDARSADQVRPLLPGSGTCAVLVTSRNQLRGLVAYEGARPLPLAPLSEAEAGELLRAALGERMDEAGGALLARRCAYLPLALRIAAARLSCDRHLTVAGYAGELADGDAFAVLDGQGDLDGALSSAFALSYRALGPAARRLFRRLSLVPGQDFTPVTAAALLGVTPSAARGPLEELCAAHLVAGHRSGRYVMHELLRGYAAGRLADEEPGAGREAYPLAGPRPVAQDGGRRSGPR
ncbi:BTAD domain-containing putative transcriptional regulator [Nonomuraea wenchangensis]